MGLDSLADSFHFTYLPLKGDGEISARFVPQPSSQFSQFGLMIRENLSANSAHGSMMIYPGKSSFVEAPRWQARFIIRPSAGAKSILSGTATLLDAPAVTFGRMTGEYWIKLQKKGEVVTGFISADGSNWNEAGSVIITGEKVMAGMAVASGIAVRTTTVMFDHVRVN